MQLIAMLAFVLALLGLIALLLPRFRVAALLVGAGITLALGRFLLFKNAPGGPAFLRSRHRRVLEAKKSL